MYTKELSENKNIISILKKNPFFWSYVNFISLISKPILKYVYLLHVATIKQKIGGKKLIFAPIMFFSF